MHNPFALLNVAGVGMGFVQIACGEELVGMSHPPRVF